MKKPENTIFEPKSLINPHRNLYISRLWILLFIFLVQACTSAEYSTPMPIATAETSSRIPTVAISPTAAPTPSNSFTEAPSPTSSPVIWQTGFESGDLRDFQETGDFVSQGSGSYTIVSNPAHSGNLAAALTIDTSKYSPTGGHAAYLFYWKDLPGREYYYSAWYYLPAGVIPHDWWTIWQWKSTYNGNTDDSEKVFSIGILKEGTQLFPYMSHRLPRVETQQHYYKYEKAVPVDQWFHIEAYYRKSTDSNGQVVVWLDGQELFNFDQVQTTLSDDTIYWSVNNYAEIILPYPYTIYVDDIAISQERIGH